MTSQTDPVQPHPAVAHLAGRLVLASGSPRRRDLLDNLGLPYDIVSPDVDETPRDGELPADLVRRLALDKALVVSAARPDAVVIAADTVIDLDDGVLGKPGTDDEARRMLRLLSGRRHFVHTGVAILVGPTVVAAEVVATEVEMVTLDDETIDWYVATGEPHDKAGAYAIQGIGGTLVAAVHGSSSNIVGLPLSRLIAMLAVAQP